MSRGISTVLDVAIACLLVTSSAVILVTTPQSTTDPDEPNAADRVGRAVLTATVEYRARDGSVVTSVADVLAGAVIDDGLPAPAYEAIRDVTDSLATPVQLTATQSMDDENGLAGVVSIGPDPPGHVDVDAAVFHIDAGPTADQHVVLTVRTWSA